MRNYQTGGIKKPAKKSSSTTPSRKILPRENVVSYMERMQQGGKKKKPVQHTDEYGKPISAAEAKRRDEAMTKSLQGYAGTAYIKKQMGSKSPVKKKMKSGGSLGMKSVKAGYDSNPGVTRADIIVAAKGKAKYGTSKKKAMGGMSMSKLANMKKGGKTAKCKYGCK
jgi:hypothetical protein